MEKVNKPLNQFCRNDGYNPSVDYSNPIQEKWIHKQVCVKVGEGEEDFVIEEKPFKIDEINIQKSIQEEAKTTDLKYLLKQLLATGDESILNQRQGFYGDITGVQSALATGAPIPSADTIKGDLPEEFKELSVEQLALMSNQEILDYFAKKKVEKNSAVENVKEGDENNG